MNTTQQTKIDGRVAPMFAFLQKQGVDFTATEHKSYKLTSEGFMPLTVETWIENETLSVSVCHYGKSNGDLMADPEIVYKKALHSDMEIPIYFKNDFVGIEQIAHKIENGQELYNRALIKDLQRFSKTWARNLKAQGHKMECME